MSATDENDDLADFSSTGPEVELAAPGVDVLSTIPRDDYAEFSGTSMSSPHVAGGAVQVVADGTTDRSVVRQKLKDTADDVGLNDNEQGAGRLNVADAVGASEGDDGSIAVSTGDATDVTDSSATLNGTLDDLGGADSADCYFEWGPSGDLSNTTDSQTLSSTGGFSEDISGLDSDTEYEFRAVADASDGDTDTGSTVAFTTDTSGGDSAPTIDTFELTDRSNPRWARVEVDWAVSDADADLSEVTSEATFADDSTDSETSSVSGDSASGTHEHRKRDAHGDVNVELTVTDGEGNTTTDTNSTNLG